MEKSYQHLKSKRKTTPLLRSKTRRNLKKVEEIPLNEQQKKLLEDIKIADIASLLETEENRSSSEENPLNEQQKKLPEDIEIADIASLLETEENRSSSEENPLNKEDPLNEEYELSNGVKIGMVVVIAGLVIAIIVVNNN